MTRQNFWLSVVGVAILSFAAGFSFCHYSIGSRKLSFSRWEKTTSIIGNSRQEAIHFLYKTIGELYTSTYNPEDGYIAKTAVERFKKYKSLLEPRCRIIDVYYYEGMFSCQVVFPSGDRFEALIQKTNNGWRLGSLRHLGTEYMYKDILDPEQAWIEGG